MNTPNICADPAVCGPAAATAPGARRGASQWRSSPGGWPTSAGTRRWTSWPTRWQTARIRTRRPTPCWPRSTPETADKGVHEEADRSRAAPVGHCVPAPERGSAVPVQLAAHRPEQAAPGVVAVQRPGHDAGEPGFARPSGLLRDGLRVVEVPELFAVVKPGGPRVFVAVKLEAVLARVVLEDRKSTRLNSSHVAISYAV